MTEPSVLVVGRLHPQNHRPPHRSRRSTLDLVVRPRISPLGSLDSTPPLWTNEADLTRTFNQMLQETDVIKATGMISHRPVS